MVKMHRNLPSLLPDQLYGISELETGVLGREPGVVGLTGLVPGRLQAHHSHDYSRFILMNASGKRHTFKKGLPIARFTPVERQYYSEASTFEYQQQDQVEQVDMVETGNDTNMDQLKRTTQT